MLRLTVVGRVSDGLPLARGPRYVNDDDGDDISAYNAKGEFLLEEISRGALPHSRMSVFLDRHCFHYMIENEICFIVLCDALYPRKLAFHYLQDLGKAFNKFDVGLAKRVVKPYGFFRFAIQEKCTRDKCMYNNWDIHNAPHYNADGIIGYFERKYADVRTQVNISKLNSDSFMEEDVISESFSHIVKSRQAFDSFLEVSKAHLNASPIWGSKRLEVIAEKWIPLGLILAVMAVLMWMCFCQAFVNF